MQIIMNNKFIGSRHACCDCLLKLCDGFAKQLIVWLSFIAFVTSAPPIQKHLHGIDEGIVRAISHQHLIRMEQAHIAHAQRCARHMNVLQPSDQAPGQVEVTPHHPGAIAIAAAKALASHR